MKIIPLFEDSFYHDGRGPELQKVIWLNEGKDLKGFEYFNPDDKYTDENLRHLILEKVEAFSMAGEEVHGDIVISGKSKAAIFKIEDSLWLKQFNPTHLADCAHYQIVFYDEIYDVICRDIKLGKGKITNDKS